MEKFLNEIHEGAVLLHKMWRYRTLVKHRFNRRQRYIIALAKGNVDNTIIKSEKVSKTALPKGRIVKPIEYIRYVETTNSLYTHGKVYKVVKHVHYEHALSQFVSFLRDDGTEGFRKLVDENGEVVDDDFEVVTIKEWYAQIPHHEGHYQRVQQLRSTSKVMSALGGVVSSLF